MNKWVNWTIGNTYCEKNTKNSGVVTFGLVDISDAKEMIINNHYSKKWNTQFGKLNIGVFKNNKLKGVAVFGRQMNPKSFKKIINDDNMDSILELNRLWISDELGKNSETLLLSVCFKYIKHNLHKVRAIQSFADGRLGCGTIYKASNFKYYGKQQSLFFEHTSGEVYHKVPMENTKRPSGFKKLNEMFIKGELKPFKVNTYRYIYVLDKKDNCILLNEEKYPEYEKGFEYCSYKPTCNQICKLIYLLKQDGCCYQYAKEWLIKNYSKEQINNSWDNTLKYFKD